VAGLDAALGQDTVSIAPGGEGLLYEKLLDLSLNPARAADTPPSSAPPDDGDGKSVSLMTLAPDHDGAPLARVVHGVKARSGEWPSAVSLSISRGGQTVLCGGTVIGAAWVLTAAHCVFTKHGGGLRSLQWATAYAKHNVRHKGELLRIKAVFVHPQFGKPAAFLNDVALLELERPTSAPRQRLVAHAAQATLLAPGTMATVIGWGITRPLRPKEPADAREHSKDLLWASVPIADRRACAAFLGREPAEAEICAGDAKGGADSCKGDSGSPLFVAGPAGQPIQAGVVSWGPGCAQPGTYGVYATVGTFEPWIRKRVPDAEFERPRPVVPALVEIAGAVPGGPPAPNGQVTVDFDTYECTDAAFKARDMRVRAAASRIRVGACIEVHVTSGVSGHLAVFSRNAQGKVQLIFPNPWRGGKQAGAAPTKVSAGQIVTIPGPADGVRFPVGMPLGWAEIIAVVVPDGAGLAELAKRFMNLRPVENFETELAAIAQRTTRQLNAVPQARRAVGTRRYEVVP
jgi:hypothetical protein